MQVKKIEELIVNYKVRLFDGSSPKDLYLWEVQQIFQHNWKEETDDFGKMYKLSIHSKKTLRYWKQPQFQPKRMMENFIEMDSLWIQSMFKDLFNEDRELESRIGRFLFLMDETLRLFRVQNPLTIDNNHYHGDYRMVSLYLAARFPTRYTYYIHDDFVRFLTNVNSPKIPEIPDFVRFCKVSKIIYTYLKKDQELMDKFQSMLLIGTHYEEASMLIVYDFLRGSRLKNKERQV